MIVSLAIIVNDGTNVDFVERTLVDEFGKNAVRAALSFERETIAHYEAGVAAGDIVSFTTLPIISSNNQRLAVFPQEF